ncbi:MAG: hypothetical protein KKF48_04315 [Nanoarchaeota archaeon]|nr:hypothetical protein [Nanoarchaeota archaeon]MBU1028242.1 hypothetical protein [Nanoarchaeota archaeon]
MRSMAKMIIFVVYLFFGIYFINYPFEIVKIPAFISTMESWLLFIGGILIIIGGINFFRASRGY